MRQPRRRRGGHEEAEENTERWTVSYMDMVTVMMCLFIVLFAISQVDQQKFQDLRQSLATSFGDPSSGELVAMEGGSGVLAADTVIPAVPSVTEQSGGLVTDGDEVRDLAAARAEAEELTHIRDQMAADLHSEGLADEVVFTITDRGLKVGLVTEHVFFSPASATMTSTARDVIDTLARTLAGIDNDLALEGHANVLPNTGRYETNWELSADRATKVLRHLVEHGGVAGGRVHAVGFGDAHPAVTEGPDALELNRRVDLLVLSDAPEHVREQLPEIARSMEGD